MKKTITPGLKCFLYLYASCRDTATAMAVDRAGALRMPKSIGKTSIITMPQPKPVRAWATPAAMAIRATYTAVSMGSPVQSMPSTVCRDL